MSIKIYIPLLLAGLIAFSCDRLNNGNREPVARVYSAYLYKDDLAGIFPANISAADSIKIARNYIDKWIRNQLFLRLAEMNLPAGEKNLDKQIADFRASLLIYKYQQHLLGQKLDSLITVREMEEYYEQHGNNFVLDKPAIRGVFLIVPVDAPDRNRLAGWLRSDNELIQIENYIIQNAITHAMFNDHWIYLDEILREMPSGSYTLPGNMLNVDHITTTDDQYHYFLGITEYRPVRSQMPFSLAMDKIKSIILNKRKIEFLQELEKNIVTEGLSKNAFQHY